MRTGIAVLHGQREQVSFELVDPAEHTGVLVIDRPDFFSPGDVFVLETEREPAQELVVEKVRPEHEDALVAFSACSA